MRFFLEISYRGTNFHGWQRQENASSVQENIEISISNLLSNQIKIVGAGRTDTGVHANQMFAHFDYVTKIDSLESLKNKLNNYLSRDIQIININRVNDDAHARFDAISRTYRYSIISQKNPFLNDFSYLFKKKVNIEKMNIASNILIDEENFKCFAKTGSDVDNFLCNITSAYWEIDNEKLVFNITSNRFLRNMVRSIVGTLLEVGVEKMTINEFKKVIESQNRKFAGPSAPASGLFLYKIKYPSHIFVKSETKK